MGLMVAKDCDGNLSFEEMHLFVENLQGQEADIKAQAMMHRVQAAGNLTMNISPDMDAVEETLRDARKRWHQFDLDGNGTLEGDELHALISFVLENVAHEPPPPVWGVCGMCVY